VGLVWQVRENARLREEYGRRDAEQEKRIEESAQDRQRAEARHAREQAEALEARSRPLVNPPLLFLQPPPERQRSSSPTDGVSTLRVPSTAEFVFLILTVVDPHPDHRYRLEVERQGAAAPIISLEDLRKSGSSEVSVGLPRGSLPDGDYRLRLLDVQTSGRNVRHEYAVRVASGDDAQH
jgi:hypothetical protein